MEKEHIHIACFAFWSGGIPEKDAGNSPVEVACRTLGRSGSLDLSSGGYRIDPDLKRFVPVSLKEFRAYMEHALFLDRNSETFRNSIFARVLSDQGTFIESMESVPSEPKRDVGVRSSLRPGRKPEPSVRNVSPETKIGPGIPAAKPTGSQAGEKGDPAASSPTPARPPAKKKRRSFSGPMNLTIVANGSAMEPVRRVSLPSVPVKEPEIRFAVPAMPVFSPAYVRVEGLVTALRNEIRILVSGSVSSADAGSDSREIHGMMEKLMVFVVSLRSGRVGPVFLGTTVTSGSDTFSKAWTTIGDLGRILFEGESTESPRQPGVVALSANEREELISRIFGIIEILHPDTVTK